MTWSDLIVLWAAEIRADPPTDPAGVAAALRRLAGVVELLSSEVGGDSRAATAEERAAVFSLLAELSNLQIQSPSGNAYRLALTMVSVSFLRTLQDYGLFEGL